MPIVRHRNAREGSGLTIEYEEVSLFILGREVFKHEGRKGKKAFGITAFRNG